MGSGSGVTHLVGMLRFGACGRGGALCTCVSSQLYRQTSPGAALRHECASEPVCDETGSLEAPCLKQEQTRGQRTAGPVLQTTGVPNLNTEPELIQTLI